jgi:tetratricopeptide (TPR) repeat protein
MTKPRKSSRNAVEPRPDPLLRLEGRLLQEPSGVLLAFVLLAAAAGLYASALQHPLVFGDFAVLTPERLKAAAAALVGIEPGALAQASYGWTWRFAGTNWFWHRGVTVVLHLGASLALFLLLRRLCRALLVPSRTDALPASWLAFAAAALFALHPAGVYAVAYLAQRPVVLGSAFALFALLALVRGVQDGRILPLVAVPVLYALAVLGTPAVAALPLVMASVVVLIPPPRGPTRTAALLVVFLCAAIAAAYTGTTAFPEAVAGAGEARATGYVDHLAVAATRVLRHYGYWLVPWTPWMAIDIPEPAAQGIASWPGWFALPALLALVAGAAWLLLRRGAAGLAGLALIAPALLALPEILWPRAATAFDLGRGYAWMPLLFALVPLGLARLPLRRAWIVALLACLLFAALADGRLRSFSSHSRLWDDAVARAQRTGAGAEAARVYLNRAALHRRDGHAFAAIADYDKVLELVPDHRRALRGRAQALLDGGRHADALRDLDRLRVLEPGQKGTIADRAVVLMEAGKAAEALREFDRAIAEGVGDARVYLNRGLARYKLGGLDAAPAALADLDRAVRISPDYALAHFNRAMIFEEAAKVGLVLRDAASPDIMRMIARQNYMTACKLGHRSGCSDLERLSRPQPGGDPVVPVSPEGPPPQTGSRPR